MYVRIRLTWERLWSEETGTASALLLRAISCAFLLYGMIGGGRKAITALLSSVECWTIHVHTHTMNAYRGLQYITNIHRISAIFLYSKAESEMQFTYWCALHFRRLRFILSQRDTFLFRYTGAFTLHFLRTCSHRQTKMVTADVYD